MAEVAKKATPAPLSIGELETIARGLIDDAIEYSELLGKDRAAATDAYHGKPYGNEEENRSRIVSRDVRDVTLGIVPDLLRVFVGSERAVEFVPTGPEDVALAEQQTDAIDAVIKADNDYTREIIAFCKDALVRKVGVIKAWREVETKISTSEYTGQTPDEQLAIMSQFPDSEITDVQIDEETGRLSFKLRKVEKIARYRVEAVPPEEFLISRNARGRHRARLIAHRQVLTVSDMVEMGYDFDEMVDLSGGVPETTEEHARNEHSQFGDSEKDPAMLPVEYIEAWMRADMDGDGVAELNKVCFAKRKYLKHEPADEAPLFWATPDPEPHTWDGLSVYDTVEDIQRIKTDITRAMLDNLARVVDPDIEYVGRAVVNPADLQNKAAGGRLIEVNAPGMIREITQQFIGPECMSALEYLNSVRDQRCGPLGSSLDPDSLQSTTAGAISLMSGSMNKRAEMIARIFCEMAIKPLFRHVAHLMIKHQDGPRMVKLRNSFIPVDPSTWKADLDLTVNVAVGAGTIEERRGVLREIAMQQKEIVQLAGPDNPICGVREVRNTLAKMAELGGHRDPTQFFKEVPVAQPTAPPPAKPTPEELMTQAQVMAIQADVQNKRERLSFELAQERSRDDRERDKHETETILKIADFAAKNPGVDAQALLTQVQAAVNANRQVI